MSTGALLTVTVVLEMRRAAHLFMGEKGEAWAELAG